MGTEVKIGMPMRRYSIVGTKQLLLIMILSA